MNAIYITKVFVSYRNRLWLVIERPSDPTERYPRTILLPAEADRACNDEELSSVPFERYIVKS